MTEEQWVRRAQAGEDEALERVLYMIQDRVYRTAYYMMGNEFDARDAAQDVLIKICQKIQLYEFRSSFQAWVTRMTTNHCIDLQRRRKPMILTDELEKTYEEQSDYHSQSRSQTEKQAIDNVFQQEIRAAMEQLPEHVRTIVIMRYINDYSYQRISEDTNLPLNTVKSHLYRARAWLMKQFQHQNNEEGVRI